MSIRQILRYFRSEWGTLTLVTVTAILGAILDATSVVFIVGVADAASKGESEVDGDFGPIDMSMSVTAAGLLAITAVVLSVLALYGVSQLRARMVTRWTRDRRLAQLDSFIQANWATQSRDRAGRLQTDLRYISFASNLLGSLVNMARGLAGLAILVGTAFAFNLVAAAGIMVLGALISTTLRPINRAVRARSSTAAQLTRKLNEDVGELSEVAREIRIFGVEEQFERRLSGPVIDLERADRSVTVLSALVTPIYQAMALSLIVIGLLAASHTDSVDVAVLGVIALLMLRSISYGQQFQSALTSLHQAAPAIEIIDASFDELQRARVEFGTSELADVQSVVIDDVAYSYDGEEVVLDDVSIELTVGEIVGVVGPSGSGKTTLAQILLRLRTPTSGEMRIDGRPAMEFHQRAWTHEIAYVPQETHLLHASVHDNIAFLRPEIGQAQVVAAAKAAGIHEVIETFPNGYQTLIGSDARQLSGGQRQRLGIARALAGRPRVIILDEPTSALDSHSEAIVQQTLERLHGEALVVVIAHRLTTLSICDRVIVLIDGKVELDGPPQSIDGLSRYFSLDAGHHEVGAPLADAGPAPG